MTIAQYFSFTILQSYKGPALSVQGSCTAENQGGHQDFLVAGGDWFQCSIRMPVDHQVNCAVPGMDVSYDRNWNQRVYICRRQQHVFEITEYSNRMYRVRLLWPSLVWRCWVRRVIFSCVVTPSSRKRSVWILKLPSYAWFFSRLCLVFLETWERSKPSGPESDDSELAHESICMLWADIFNSRYFSGATWNSDWHLLRNNFKQGSIGG